MVQKKERKATERCYVCYRTRVEGMSTERTSGHWSSNPMAKLLDEIIHMDSLECICSETVRCHDRMCRWFVKRETVDAREDKAMEKSFNEEEARTHNVRRRAG